MYRPKVGARRLDRIAPDAPATDFALIDLTPICATIGVEIGGVDLSRPLPEALFA